MVLALLISEDIKSGKLARWRKEEDLAVCESFPLLRQLQWLIREQSWLERQLLE